MSATMRNVNHAANLGASGPTADMSLVIGELRKIAQALHELVDKEPVTVTGGNPIDFKLPQFVNEVAVSPTPIEVAAPRVDNNIAVNPTPVEIQVLPTPIDVTSLVTAIYVLVGVFGAFAIGVLLSFLRNCPS